MQSLVGHSAKCILWKLLWLGGLVSLVAGAAALAWYGGDLVLHFKNWWLMGVLSAALAISVKMDCKDCSTCNAG